MHRRRCPRLQLEAEPRREADPAQHAQMIFLEPLVRIADGAARYPGKSRSASPPTKSSPTPERDTTEPGEASFSGSNSSH
jgi:hypothetical protein